MIAANLKQLIPSLTLKTPNCGDGVRLRALQESATRFCDQSKAWLQSLTPIDTVASQLEYTVVNPWTADIVSIKRIGIRTAAQITANANDEGTEIPFSWYSFDQQNQKIVFKQSPASTAVTSAILVKAVLVPQFECQEIAAWFLNLYREGIVAGAASDICSNPIQTIYNPNVIRSQRIVFDNQVSKAVADSKRNWTETTLVAGRGYDLI